MSTYDFSTLYTKLPHNLIKENLLIKLNKLLTERAHFIWFVMRNAHFSLLNNQKDLNCGHVRKLVTLSFFYNILIRFDSKLYRKIISIPIGSNCADLLLQFCFVLL